MQCTVVSQRMPMRGAAYMLSKQGVGTPSSVSTFNPERAPTHCLLAASTRASESRHLHCFPFLCVSLKRLPSFTMSLLELCPHGVVA